MFYLKLMKQKKRLIKLEKKNIDNIYNKYTNLLCIHNSNEEKLLKILKKFI